MANYTVTLDAEGTTVTNDQFNSRVAKGPWFRYLSAVDEWLGDEAGFRRTAEWEILYLARYGHAASGVRLTATVVPL